MCYTEDFLGFYRNVEPIFHHRLYGRDGFPAVGLLRVQEYHESLLAGDFLDTYRVTNKSIINNYSHMERIKNHCTKDDILNACLSYKPLPGEKSMALPDYFIYYETRFSSIIEDILNPGFSYSKRSLNTLYPNEMKILEGMEKVDIKVYKRFIDEMGFPDTIQTKKKYLALYEWWKLRKDIIWRFAESDINYQKTFSCFLEHALLYYESWDNRDMVYNIFGSTSGKMFEKFIDYCVGLGYNLRYDERSWMLPWNRKIV
jgi:hypothetical protein